MARLALFCEGPLAGALRRAAYWYRQPTGEQRLRVGAAWLEQLSQDGLKAFQVCPSPICSSLLEGFSI